MTCNCVKPTRTSVWTPIPEFSQPTEILPGENIDCYMKRASTVEKNDVAEKPLNKIENTSITSDLNAKVDVTFKLTPESTRVATRWSITKNGESITSAVIPHLFANGNRLYGTVTPNILHLEHKIMVRAFDANGLIDEREYTFVPKQGSKDDTVKFIFPLPGAQVTCGFGPRNPPARGASSAHKGIDIAYPNGKIGDIVSAADGTVVAAGPATGFGNWIKIEHRDAQGKLVATTVYGHMNEIYVKVGQKVAAGQKIAREGNAGIGTGAHLHFELHKGSWGNPVDPIPYLNGTFKAADNNLPGQKGVPDPNSFKTVSQKNVGMTSKEANAANSKCPAELPNQAPPTSESNPEPIEAPQPAIINKSPNRSACAPENTPNAAQVRAEIERALNEAQPPLSADDKKFIIQVATIESGLDPYAKNPTSSATGLYQMLDKTANEYYRALGIPATCKNRCDPYISTKAMILMYEQQYQRIWKRYVSSGKTLLGGKPIVKTPFSDKYPTLTQGEFMYGLLHHDGLGNAINGIDKQGVDYWRKKIRS